MGKKERHGTFTFKYVEDENGPRIDIEREFGLTNKLLIAMASTMMGEARRILGIANDMSLEECNGKKENND